MEKRKFNTLIIVLSALVLVLCFKLFMITVIQDREISTEKTFTTAKSIKEIHEITLKNSTPTVVLVSYESNCCEKTKQFLIDYKNDLKTALDSSNETLNLMYIDILDISPEDNNHFLELMHTFGVSDVPFIIFIDNNAVVKKLIQGNFKENDVHSSIEEMMK